MDIGEINNAYKQLDDSVGSAGRKLEIVWHHRINLTMLLKMVQVQLPVWKERLRILQRVLQSLLVFKK